MLSAEAYGAEVGSATPSSMSSPPGSEIGDCSQANLCRVAPTRPFSFLPASNKPARLHKREPANKMFYSQKRCDSSDRLVFENRKDRSIECLWREMVPSRLPKWIVSQQTQVIQTIGFKHWR